jgi:hypothetical protein
MAGDELFPLVFNGPVAAASAGPATESSCHLYASHFVLFQLKP